MTYSRLALDRTLLLMRDDVHVNVPDTRLLTALLDTTVLIHADRANLLSAAGQTALTTTALLVSRSGTQVFLDIPDVPIVGQQPPFGDGSLLTEMMKVGQNILPGMKWIHGRPLRSPDLTIVIGDTISPFSQSRQLVLSGDAWTGSMAQSGGRWSAGIPPVGALIASTLAAGEAYKLAMRRLQSGAIVPNAFDQMFAPVREATVALAPSGVPFPQNLGTFDCISGGAIAQSALYTLARFGCDGNARIIEPETSDLTNLNRYALLLRSHVGTAKATDLANVLHQTLTVTPIVERYDEAFSERHGPLREYVLVGVDHIPTRWTVQEAEPLWLGIGATSHYSAMASDHTSDIPCARCLHPVDDDFTGPIPTAAFVSHWAGLCLAVRFVLRCVGVPTPARQQSTYMTMLRPDSPGAIVHSPVAVRAQCQRDRCERRKSEHGITMDSSIDRVA